MTTSAVCLWLQMGYWCNEWNKKKIVFSAFAPFSLKSNDRRAQRDIDARIEWNWDSQCCLALSSRHRRTIRYAIMCAPSAMNQFSSLSLSLERNLLCHRWPLAARIMLAVVATAACLKPNRVYWYSINILRQFLHFFFCFIMSLFFHWNDVVKIHETTGTFGKRWNSRGDQCMAAH